MKGRIIALLFLSLAAGQAAACSYIAQIQVSFESGSAALDQSQIIKLTEWLDRSYKSFSKYTSGSVETGASGAIAGKAKALAELRATHTVRALRMLLRTDLRLETFSSSYRSPTNHFGESNDFASIQLYPDAEALKLPKCHSAPAAPLSGADAKASP